jgi:hypothetical protein
MPIKRFWQFNSNIGRISSEEDLRSLNVSICSQSNEGIESLSKSLTSSLGEVVVKQIGRDEASIAEFKKAFS